MLISFLVVDLENVSSPSTATPSGAEVLQTCGRAALPSHFFSISSCDSASPLNIPRPHRAFPLGSDGSHLICFPQCFCRGNSDIREFLLRRVASFLCSHNSDEQEDFWNTKSSVWATKLHVLQSIRVSPGIQRLPSVCQRYTRSSRASAWRGRQSSATSHCVRSLIQ